MYEFKRRPLAAALFTVFSTAASRRRSPSKFFRK